MKNNRIESKALRTIVVVLILVFDLIIGVYSMKSAHQSGFDWKLADQRLGMIDRTLELLKDAESSQRSYLLTGDRACLVPYRKAIPLIEESVDRLEASIPENPSGQARFGELKYGVGEMLEEHSQTLDWNDQEGLECERETIRADRSRQAMSIVRQVISNMKTEQIRLKKLHAERYFQSVRRSIHAICIGVILFLAIIAIPRFSRVESPA
jgi:CHASE3 domain sensor protein